MALILGTTYMSHWSRTVTSKLASLGLESAKEAGISPAEFQRLTGISLLEANDPHGRISATKHIAMLNLIERLDTVTMLERSGNAPLRAPFGTLIGVISNSRTLREAFDNYVRIKPLIGDVDDISFQVVGDLYEFVYTLDDPQQRTAMSAFGHLASMADLARQYTENDRLAATIELVGKPFPGWKRLAQYKSCKVVFEQPANRMQLRLPTADEPYHLYNRFAFDAIDGQANHELKLLEQQRSFAVRVLALINELEMYASEGTLLTLVCEKFSISRSALHRRLQREGTNFQSVATQARLCRAKQMLSQQSMPISMISDELGFSSVSVFSRFFSGHYGQSPSRYRAINRPD
ncbi:AraC family transcriptional regulator [Paraburkholderia dinghuensis]|uniref:AraC family transcriptional regulator n=1 Tax=Paraburkholderia dinghuensis TaxID=2305225 RepID=A0A3N6N9S6_9BURK|nr:AraC family transcriptional regulator [Paraburkholderia dinghuensis]RQH04977.1 AraC family transcriptional regulator [Paraburkholderia dinghuensis]